jgi:prophage regulatory protein
MNNAQVLGQIQEMIKENEKPLTFTQALEFLQVSPSTLYKLTHKKQISYTKPGGGKLYFKKDDLLTWMNRNPVKTAEQIDEEAANYLINK